MRSKVTFYSPAFASAATLPASIESIRQQKQRPWELLCVQDSGPADAWTTASSLGVQVLEDHGTENRGLAASCNTALRHATGEFLAKIDSDVQLSPFWLDRVLPHFRDDRVAGVGGRMIEALTNTLAGRWRAAFMPQHWGTDPITNPGFLFGANQIFRVEALKKVGGWNQKYRTNYEDVDLCKRLRAAGYILVYEPKAVARHLRQDSLPGVLTNFWKWYYPPAEDAGYFNNIDAAVKHIEANFHLATNQFAQRCVLGGSPELSYPSYLLFPWLCLCDLDYLGARGAMPTEAVTITQTAVIMATLNRKGMPEFLQREMAKDIIARWPQCGQLIEGWEPDPAYLSAYHACVGQLELGEFARWALETSVMGRETTVGSCKQIKELEAAIP